MKQIIQYQKTGEMMIKDLPAPVLKDGGILVQNVFSLISSGTERSSVETAKASLISKARSRPDLVKQVIDNVKREGLITTYKKVQNRLDKYKEFGYSSAGIVLETSSGRFKIGDRVACAGTGYASHAEVIFVPQNLAVKIPDTVSFEDASFTTLGAIALQGIRQADVHLNEYVAVIGLGLLGLLTVRLLKINGCSVIGLDISDNNFQIAKEFGCDEVLLSNSDSVSAINSLTKGFGTDAVIITASARSNEPLEYALRYARKKSKIVIVGSVNMNIPRSPFYEKELDLKISCSYGPGRYDYNYEEFGIDYPIGYVRWTENRNMQTVLDLIADKSLDVSSLISHKIPISRALDAYAIITGKIKDPYRGILIEYPFNEFNDTHLNRVFNLQSSTNKKTVSSEQNLPDNCKPGNYQDIKIGFIGVGNFAQNYLLPTLVKHKITLCIISNSLPLSSDTVGKKYSFNFCSSDINEVFLDSTVNTVFIATRHDSHTQLTLKSLKNNKHTFVEKPVAINRSELMELYNYLSENQNGLSYMVGFNRRFSKTFIDIKNFFNSRNEPLFITYRVNAGAVPADHWLNHKSQGGRIIGEACHFIDCMQYLTDSEPVTVFASSLDLQGENNSNTENINVTINFRDGSIGNLIYIANGNNSLPKEYCEVSSGGKTAVMNNFHDTIFYTASKKRKIRYHQGKGHREEVEHFLNVITGKENQKLSFNSACLTTLTTFCILDSIKRREVVEIL